MKLVFLQSTREAVAFIPEGHNFKMQSSSKSAFISTGRSENVQIGSKSATLYLSSSSLKLHDKRCSSREAGSPVGTESKSQSPAPSETNTDKNTKLGTAPGRSTAYSRRSQTDEDIGREVSKLQPIREFTFTGYDIMADGNFLKCSLNDKMY